MVGTYRGTGCDNCRKRKKKCGEEVPECLACKKAGWRCLGYPNRWKFVEENQQLAQTYRKKKYIFEDADDSAPADTDAFPHSDTVIKKEFESAERLSKPGITWSLASPNDPTCSRLCYILEEPHCRTTFPIQSHGSFYARVPVRLSHSTVLYDAVSCLCSFYIDSLRHPSSASNASFRLYAQSLQSLRRSLNTPQARTTSETICASIILQLCELITNDKSGQWNHLCQGTKLLIMESGPERFKAPFERAMLESQRAWFIVQDASSGQDCFLAEHCWRQLLNSCCLVLEDQPAGLSLRAQLCGFLVDVPRLIRQATEVTAQILIGKIEWTGLAERRQTVIHQICFFKQAFERWYCTKLQQSRSKSKSTQFENAKASYTRDFGNEALLVAAVDCVANSVLIKLDLLLLGLSTTFPGQKFESSVCQDTISGRREVMFESLNHVRSKSSVAAKPLEFGLQQLWLETGV